MTIKSIAVGERRIKPGRIFCIGKNYAEHILELGDTDTTVQPKTGEHPVVFMKPVTSIVSLGELIHAPMHGNVLHYEAEVVIFLSSGGKNILMDVLYSAKLAKDQLHSTGVAVMSLSNKDTGQSVINEYIKEYLLFNMEKNKVK